MNIVRIKGVKTEQQVKEALKRHEAKIDAVKQSVETLIARVRREGDEALIACAKEFDHVDLTELKVSEQEIQGAVERSDPALIEALMRAKQNIETYHQKQRYEPFCIKEEGVYLTQKVTPLARVGLYVPNGRYPYPSTVLMTSIPAKVAGVGEIAMISPAGKDGKIADNILLAAHVCGIEEIYKTGGAHGIAALAYGTQSIRSVDKICGPGNVFVTLAKRLVYGDVDIDMLAGPSEILIIADEKANPAYIAADMLSQAEHDANAAAMLVTTSEALVGDVCRQIQHQLENLPLQSRQTAEASIENFGQIFVVDTIKDAFFVSNTVAPEHLEIALEDAGKYVDLVKNAGSVFLGEYTPEPVGDYYAGANHTIPTSGKARFFSPLSAYDFCKRTSIVQYGKDKLLQSAKDIMLLAKTEGLYAHHNAVRIRLEGEKQ